MLMHINTNDKILVSASDIMVDYTPDKLPEVGWTQSLSHPQPVRLRDITIGARNLDANQLDRGICGEKAASTVTLNIKAGA